MRLSSVVLPAPGADIRLTVRDAVEPQKFSIGRGDAIVLVENALEHGDPARTAVGVSAVVADIPV